jgi:hypothetical protein
LVIILCSGSGCSRSDPVAELQRAVDKYRASLKAVPPGVNPPSDFELDVRRTDSLITPYVGTVSYSIDMGVRIQCRVSFAYRDKRWAAEDVGGELHDQAQLESALYILQTHERPFTSQAQQELQQWQAALGK